MKNFTDYKAIIDFLMKKQGKTLEEAMRETEAPPHLQDQIRDYFKLDKESPKKISFIQEKDNNIVLCEPNRANEFCFRDFIDFIENKKKWPRVIAENLSHASRELLKRLPDPQKNEKFQHKGLVVGHIQSGKTANMSALIARAADHGYRFFIILAGRYKDLRLQTQNRMDQDITGESEIEFLQCAEHSAGARRWNRMTRAEIDGDFKEGTGTLDPNPDTAKIAIIKKNTWVMDRLIRYLKNSTVSLENFPALIIDDECDDSSININYEEEGDEPSKTNEKIRSLLKIFPKYAYVGFTATPFANVLIDAEVPEDLYPKNFISVLEEPEGYIGPRQLFGLGMMPPSELSEEEEEEEPEIDVIREISRKEEEEAEEAEANKEPPAIIEKAILTFVLSCCARMARGQSEEHFSMLIHPSYRKHIHGQYKKWTDGVLKFLKGVVQHPSKAKEYIKKARAIWENDFIETSRKSSIDKDKLFDFEQIWKFAKEIVDSIEVKVLNSDFQDTLEYHESKRRYIIIGGNKLSRGLTLEGLGISLYLRPEPESGHKYDTLLQMGRWFGYRKGYLDLTRIFVNLETADDFSDLARVELELREDLKKYSKSSSPQTPLEIKPLIRAHPTMSVTSPLKFGAGKKIHISFQNSTNQTIVFPLNEIKKLKENKKNAMAWLNSLGNPASGKILEGSWAWKNIEPKKIIELIRSYHFGKGASRVDRGPIESYIKRQNEKGELTEWTVFLPPGSKKCESFSWMSGVSTGKVTRLLKKRRAGERRSIKVLTESKDIKAVREAYSISSDPEHPTDSKKAALLIYAVDKKSGAGTDSALFPNSEGEDIIGLAFVFPHSTSEAVAEWITQEKEIF